MIYWHISLYILLYLMQKARDWMGIAVRVCNMHATKRNAASGFWKSGNLFEGNRLCRLQIKIDLYAPWSYIPLYYQLLGYNWGCLFSTKGIPKFLQKWLTPRSGRLWGIQIRPFGVHETYLRNINFHFLKRPHAALPFSCTRRIAGAGAGGSTR